MAELKLTFSDNQVTRIKKAIRDKYGNDERTDNQLMKIDVKNYIISLVRNYEKKVAVAGLNLADF